MTLSALPINSPGMKISLGEYSAPQKGHLINPFVITSFLSVLAAIACFSLKSFQMNPRGLSWRFDEDPESVLARFSLMR